MSHVACKSFPGYRQQDEQLYNFLSLYGPHMRILTRGWGLSYYYQKEQGPRLQSAMLSASQLQIAIVVVDRHSFQQFPPGRKSPNEDSEGPVGRL